MLYLYKNKDGILIQSEGKKKNLLNHKKDN